MDLFKFFKKKEPTRRETISQMRDEEKKEFKEKMKLIRLSQLTEEEKKKQRDEVRKEHNHLMDIYK